MSFIACVCLASALLQLSRAPLTNGESSPILEESLLQRCEEYFEKQYCAAMDLASTAFSNDPQNNGELTREPGNSDPQGGMAADPGLLLTQGSAASLTGPGINTKSGGETENSIPKEYMAVDPDFLLSQGSAAISAVPQITGKLVEKDEPSSWRKGLNWVAKKFGSKKPQVSTDVSIDAVTSPIPDEETRDPFDEDATGLPEEFTLPGILNRLAPGMLNLFVFCASKITQSTKSVEELFKHDDQTVTNARTLITEFTRSDPDKISVEPLELLTPEICTYALPIVHTSGHVEMLPLRIIYSLNRVGDRSKRFTNILESLTLNEQQYLWALLTIFRHLFVRGGRCFNQFNAFLEQFAGCNRLNLPSSEMTRRNTFSIQVEDEDTPVIASDNGAGRLLPKYNIPCSEVLDVIN
ncbi:hypothetical protein RF11_08861 [Thelohanellus kitauei]|uniref:Uncharacterized protein n=1 Tax=Thelohanellus kitauei TaxID=669202 RepID=A0A0C2M3Z8_THEKT|nr:hypothetical protein RF11_08861 [Thelohanellus kitauei]